MDLALGSLTRVQAFEDVNKPKVMVRVGNSGDAGTVELSDLLFTARGPTAGLVSMEWNLKGTSRGAAAMWGTYQSTRMLCTETN